MRAELSSESFGQTPDGRAAALHTLQIGELRVRITDYGGRIVSIETPDRDGTRGEVLLGFSDAASGNTLHGGPRGFEKVYWQLVSATVEPLPTLISG